MTRSRSNGGCGPKRVLLSEGSSLSARQAVTALGLAGHRVGVCDPSPLCLGRFSRFVTKWHQCPPAGKDPSAYLECVLSILDRGAYEVLFPPMNRHFYSRAGVTGFRQA